MNDKQPEALRLADDVFLAIPWVPAGAPARKTLGDAAALLRTQHAAIERKDALLKRALKTIGTSIPLDAESADALCQTILKELAK